MVRDSREGQRDMETEHIKGKGRGGIREREQGR